MGGHVNGNDVVALVDADGNNCIPVEYILDQRKKILLTSSPRTSQDRKWLNQHATRGAVFIMEPCSPEETVLMGCVYS
jgi:hypothetical protein